MAWTAPKTFSTDEVVTAAHLNTHLRDNISEAAPAKVTTAGDVVFATGANALDRLGLGSSGYQMLAGASAPEYKGFATGIRTSSHTVNNTVTLEADDVLLFPIGANEDWIWEMGLFVLAHVDANLKFAFTVPSGSDFRWALSRIGESGAGAKEAVYQHQNVASTSLHMDVETSGSLYGAHIFGGIENGATPDNVKLWFAQSSAHASDASIVDKSWFKAHQIS